LGLISLEGFTVIGVLEEERFCVSGIGCAAQEFFLKIQLGAASDESIWTQAFEEINLAQRLEQKCT